MQISLAITYSPMAGWSDWICNVTVDFSEDDSLVEVESIRGTATGRIRLDLKTLGSNGTATGTSNIKVVIVEDGNRENREINEGYELRISSTTTVREDRPHATSRKP